MDEPENETEYFQEYYDEEFLKNFQTTNNIDSILFIIARNEDQTKFLVMTDDYADSAPMSKYIKVWEADGEIDKEMTSKIKRLDDRHSVICALVEQNPNVPVCMNPFAPTNNDDLNVLIKRNKIFIVNYVDDEVPAFVYDNRCLATINGKPKNVERFEGCRDCSKTSYDEGCSEVKKWFDKVFGDIVDDSLPPPIFECSNKCNCFNGKDICLKRISYINRDDTPLVIFKTNDKGWALAAGRDMEPEELVTEYVGVIFDDVETKLTHDSTYCFNMDYMRDALEGKYGPNFQRDNRYYLIDSKQMGNESRFANHSCDPNMKVVVSFGTYKSPTFHKVFYFTKKEIPMGSELTVSYFHEPGENNSNALRCKCGAVNCMEILPIVKKR